VTEHRLIRTPPGAGCVTVKDGRELVWHSSTSGWSLGCRQCGHDLIGREQLFRFRTLSHRAQVRILQYALFLSIDD
jgi:hypothetical protein